MAQGDIVDLEIEERGGQVELIGLTHAVTRQSLNAGVQHAHLVTGASAFPVLQRLHHRILVLMGEGGDGKVAQLQAVHSRGVEGVNAIYVLEQPEHAAGLLEARRRMVPGDEHHRYFRLRQT